MKPFKLITWEQALKIFMTKKEILTVLNLYTSLFTKSKIGRRKIVSRLKKMKAIQIKILISIIVGHK